MTLLLLSEVAIHCMHLGLNRLIGRNGVGLGFGGLGKKVGQAEDRRLRN